MGRVPIIVIAGMTINSKFVEGQPDHKRRYCCCIDDVRLGASVEYRQATLNCLKHKSACVRDDRYPPNGIAWFRRKDPLSFLQNQISGAVSRATLLMIADSWPKDGTFVADAIDCRSRHRRDQEIRNEFPGD